MGQCLQSADKNKDGKLDAKEIAELVVHTLDRAGVLIKQAETVAQTVSEKIDEKPAE